MTKFLSDLLRLVGLIPIFGGFLYYIGRRFTESYFEVFGIPSESLNLTTADYLYKSIQSWMFLIALALTYLVFILWQSLFKKPEVALEIPNHAAKKPSKLNLLRRTGGLIIRIFKPAKGDPQLLMLLYFFYTIFTVALILVLLISISEPNFVAEAFTEFMMLILSMGLAWLIITDKPTISFVKTRKWLSQLFIASTIFTLVVSMQLLPHGVGRLVGIIQTNPSKIDQTFPAVQIISNDNLWEQNITWTVKNNQYETQNPLILIFQNNEGIFVKRIIEAQIDTVKVKKLSETYYIPFKNIEGLSFNMPGQLIKPDK